MKTLLKQCRKGMGVLGLLVLLTLAACGTNSGDDPGANNPVTPQKTNGFTFNLVPSPNITKCLPHAGGSVTIVPNDLNDLMMVNVTGLAPNTGYDLFVLQLPNKPFGVAWYQSDLETDGHGSGSVNVRGIFNNETFSISTGGTTTFPATHQYHLGLWFNDPQVPFKLGCEPGATSPTVTPFNGEQHAGVQVLNTSNFPDNAGPLSHVSA